MNDYISILITLLIGLALCDLLVSTHRLLRARKTVKWDWMTPVLAVIMFLQLLGFWWMWFHMYDDVKSLSVLQFLPDIMILSLLFLACASVLPDEIDPTGFDLRAHYFENARYFWTLFWLYCLVGTIFIMGRNFPAGTPLTTILAYSLPNLVLVTAGIALSRTSRPWAHKAFLLILLPYTMLVQLTVTMKA